MATNINVAIPTHLGLADSVLLSDLHGNPGHSSLKINPMAYMPANTLAELFQKYTLATLGGGIPYASGLWTVTTTGTGAAAAQGTHPGGGVLLTCGSDSTFNTNLQSKAGWTPVANKWVCAACRVQTSSITTVGFEFNIGSSAVDPATTNYTDVIGFKMAVGSGAVVGKVRGNADTQVTTSTLYTMTAATDAYFALIFKLNATAANNAGWFIYGSSPENITGVTSIGDITGGLAQMALILTTPQTMYLNLHAKGSTGNPTVSFSSAFGVIDS